MHQHIFGDEPPAGFSLERFDVAARCHVPLRKNSKLIKNEERKTQAKFHEEDDTGAPVAAAALLVDDETEAPAWARRLIKSQTSQALDSKTAPALVHASASTPSAKDDMPKWAVQLLRSQEQFQQQQEQRQRSRRRPPKAAGCCCRSRPRQGRPRPDQAKAGHNRQASQAKAGLCLWHYFFRLR